MGGISAHANGKDAELGIKAGMDRFMGKPVPLKSLKDLAQCKRVLEASTLLEAMFKRSSEVLVAATKLAEEISDEGEDSKSSRSSFSSTNGSCLKQSTLIAMREEPDLHALKRIVEKAGWRVAVVNNGGDALRLLKMKNWDAVFIDHDLPVFTGSSALVRFRQWEERSRVVQQKNIYTISDTFASAPAGSDGVLSKPLDLQLVLQVIHAASKETLKVSVVALR